MEKLKLPVIILAEDFRKLFESYRTKKCDNPKFKLAGYYRKSVEDNVDFTSLGPQRDYVHAFAEKNGFLVIGDFQDELSGFDENRPGLKAAVEACIAQKADALVVYKLNRLARSEKIYFDVEAECRKHNIEILSATEPLDLTPASGLLKSLLVGQGAYHSRELAQNVMRSMTAHTSLGKSGGGFAPWGYELVNKHTHVLTTDAEHVLFIFESVAAGLSYQYIFDSFEARDVKPPKSKTWRKSTLLSILKNRKYMGHYTWNDSWKRKRKPKIIRASLYSEVVVENAIPQIIPPELFNRVQEIINARKGQSMKACEGKYILKGKIICPLCGSNMHGSTRKGGRNKVRQDTYHCKNHKSKSRPGWCPTKDISRNDLENAVFHCMDVIFSTEDFQQKLVDGLYPQKDKLKKAIADKGRRIERLKSDISVAARKSLDSRLEDVYTDTILEMKDAVKANEKHIATLGDKLKTLESFSDNMPGKNVAEFSNVNKRLLIDALIKQIHAVHEGNAVEIDIK